MTEMNLRETVSGWLAEMTPSVGLDIQLDEDGTCAVEFPDDLVVMLNVAEEHYTLAASLIEAPAESNPRTLEKALRLNMDYSVTRGGFLGFFELHHELVYLFHREVGSDDNAQSFANRFMNFISTSYDLRAQLLAALEAELRGEAPDFPPPSPDAPLDPQGSGNETSSVNPTMMRV